MTYYSLYRKYKPKDFKSIVGQEHIIEILKNSLIKKKIHHAFLFCGSKGIGKTTTAKIFAKAINCKKNIKKIICNSCKNCFLSDKDKHPDIIEIDAASNNGVDEIRNLINTAKFSPILGKKKIYIIDEIHMLSKGAFNALLKILEDPYKHIIFILITTEIFKILPTIISRCLRFDFLKISENKISIHLKKILKLEKIKFEPEVPTLLSTFFDGDIRESITSLERLIILIDEKNNIIKKEDILKMFGFISLEEKIQIFKFLKNNEFKKVLKIIKKLKNKTLNIENLFLDLLENFKDSLLFFFTNSYKYINLNQKKFIIFLNKNINKKMHFKIIDLLLFLLDRLKNLKKQFIFFEILVFKIFTLYKKNNYFDILLYKKKQINKNIKNKKIKKILFLKSKKKNVLKFLNLIFEAKKKIRFKDEKNFSNLLYYGKFEKWKNFCIFLTSAKIVLSGEKFIVFSFKSSYEIKKIMNIINIDIKNFFDFIKILFEKKKNIFLCKTNFFKKIVNFFLYLKKNKKNVDTINEKFLNKFFIINNNNIKKKKIKNNNDIILNKLYSIFGDKINFFD